MYPDCKTTLNWETVHQKCVKDDIEPHRVSWWYPSLSLISIASLIHLLYLSRCQWPPPTDDVILSTTGSEIADLWVVYERFFSPDFSDQANFLNFYFNAHYNVVPIFLPVFQCKRAHSSYRGFRKGHPIFSGTLLSFGCTSSLRRVLSQCSFIAAAISQDLFRFSFKCEWDGSQLVDFIYDRSPSEPHFCTLDDVQIFDNRYEI